MKGDLDDASAEHDFHAGGDLMLFVDNVKVASSDARNTHPQAVNFPDDTVVRDYLDWQELADHVGGTTDHVGNLGPTAFWPGVWLRFRKEGLNILGEDHTEVDLEQVIPALGITSFTYEQFSSDDLPGGSFIRAAYLTENTAALARMGVNLAGNLREVGGESLYPKIADTMAELDPYLDAHPAYPMLDLCSGGDRYLGQPDQRYLKIGWAHAKDIAAAPVTAKEKTLAHLVNDHNTMALLDPYITGLRVDGFLGDTLRLNQHQNKHAPLLAITRAYVAVMLSRALGDPALTTDQKTELADLPQDTWDEHQELFALWRNFHFAHVVAKAAGRGVRYAGMGDAHRAWLTANDLLPDEARGYDLSYPRFAVTVRNTRILRQS